MLDDFCAIALYLIEILHQTTTEGTPYARSLLLYLIEILHQTTTRPLLCLVLQELYLIEILHQTTTRPSLSWPLLRCILSKFYIKPQLEIVHSLQPCVVSYRNSTSNHNSYVGRKAAGPVVSYRNSTSNHNRGAA